MSKPNEKRNRKIQRRGGNFDGAVSPRALRNLPGYSEPWHHDEDPRIERELAEERRQWEKRNEWIDEQRRKQLEDRRRPRRTAPDEGGKHRWRRCPCGCGKKLPKAEARYVKTLDDRIEVLDHFNNSGIASGEQLSNGQDFVREGRQFRAGIVAIFHGADPDIIDRRQLDAWIEFANKAKKGVRREMKGAGLQC